MTTDKTANERQRKFYEAQKDKGMSRVKVYLDAHSTLTMKRLAKKKGLTQGELLAQLLTNEEKSMLSVMPPEEQSKFYDAVRA